ncbi:beta-1,3-mannanase [Polyplosphaeria fusca]|uniref:mannan endo-1,4-beta-mannosidase n=1 Tax=Polyplosphaeria fusca TaxID=682080 RepID=A0A9P4R111_9PLEO|nr:beta-1,3-mannanase [Polyplosphaeria fusca]
MGAADAHPFEERAASKSWAGSNEYFLHALPASEQKKYIETLAGWGVKVLRLWVTDISSGCLKGSTSVKSIPPLESTIGTYDTTVLKALDSTLSLLHANKIKAILSPHNANTLGGSAGCDAYCNKFGASDSFYASGDGKKAYDARIKTILNFKSPAFGKAWKELDDVILAVDLQNEPMISSVGKLQANDPDDWLCGRAKSMRKVLGKSGVRVATGGIGGSHYVDHEFNLLDKALKCDAIDVMSVHGYMGKAQDWEYYMAGDKSVIAQAKKAGKLAMVEEWGVAADSQDNFDKQVKVFNDAGEPWLYWQVVPGKDQTESGAPQNCGYDGFEIGLNSKKGNFKAAVAAANKAKAAQDWTGA